MTDTSMTGQWFRETWLPYAPKGDSIVYYRGRNLARVREQSSFSSRRLDRLARAAWIACMQGKVCLTQRAVRGHGHVVFEYIATRRGDRTCLTPDE